MKIEDYLTYLEIAIAAARAANLGGDKVKALASLQKVVSGGLAAYTALAGHPIDLTKLQPIEPL